MLGAKLWLGLVEYFHGNPAQDKVSLMQLQKGKSPTEHGWWSGGRKGCLPLTLLAPHLLNPSCIFF